MHHFPYPSYLRTHRKRWGLSQPELAALLGVRSASAISRYEQLTRRPSIDVLIGSEFIFGESARRLFPAVYAAIELKITARAALFDDGLADLETRDAREKRQLLEAIAMRAASDQSII